MANGTKILSFLKRPIVAGVLKSVPFGIGSLLQNVLGEVGGAGNVDKKELPAQLVKIGIYVVLLYLVFSGKLDMSQAEDFKDFIND